MTHVIIEIETCYQNFLLVMDFTFGFIVNLKSHINI